MEKREMKFKIWHQDIKSMTHSDLNLFGIAGYLGRMIHQRGEYEMKAEHCIFLQFTGLKDKNDKEIYEGDLVRHWTIEQLHQVIFVQGAFGYLNCCDGEFISYAQNVNFHTDGERYLDVEIIGNIYENQELLSQTF